MQHNKAMEAWKAQQQGRLVQAYVSAAMMFAAYGMTQGLEGMAPKTPQGGSGRSMYAGNVGGSVPGFASGGYVDNVPAMLMSGEMVMNRDSVNKHGRGFFERLNKGQLPATEGFEGGGMVGGGFSSTSSSTSSIDLFDRLIESTDALKTSIDDSKFGKNNEKSSTDEVSKNSPQSSPTNNVTINVSVDKSGNTTSDSEASTSGGDDRNDNAAAEKKAIAMSESIRTSCLDVIMNEKRPGGALSEHGIGGR